MPGSATVGGGLSSHIKAKAIVLHVASSLYKRYNTAGQLSNEISDQKKQRKPHKCIHSMDSLQNQLRFSETVIAAKFALYVYDTVFGHSQLQPSPAWYSDLCANLRQLCGRMRNASIQDTVV